MFQDEKILEKLTSLIFNFRTILLNVLKEQKEPKISLTQFRILNILRLKKIKIVLGFANTL